MACYFSLEDLILYYLQRIINRHTLQLNEFYVGIVSVPLVLYAHYAVGFREFLYSIPSSIS
jgi:hypothetical protein